MDAMDYEFLLRQVYQCGRDYKNGADADIYRAMEHAHSNLTTKTLYKTQEEREYQFKKAFAAVRRYVRDAIDKGIIKIKHSASKEEINELERIGSLLTLSFYDKVKLDEIIENASDIFHTRGLSV